jgi:beta-lactamase regulating signal transducer with metallopeptidase domain
MTADEIFTRAFLGLQAVWRSSWQATVLIVAVLLVQLLFSRRLSARWRYNLWLIVLIRLALPVTPSSRLSVYNFLPDRVEPASPSVAIAFAEPIDVPLNIAPALPKSRTFPAPLITTTTATRAFNWRPLLPILWLAGAMLLMLRICWTTVALHRSIRKLRPVADPAILDVFEAARRELSVSHRVELLSADIIQSPALTGIFRPKLLIPPAVLANFDPGELRLIFLHELGHLRRNDVAANWLMTILLIVHWFNPILWLALARMRSDRELACDELVLSVTRDNDRTIYGHTILKLLQSLSRPRAIPGMVGILENPNPTRRRITMIAAFERRTRRWTVPAVLTMIAIGCVALTDSVKTKPQAATESAAQSAPKPVAASQPTDPRDPTLEHLAQQDPTLRAYLKQADDLNYDIKTKLLSLGENNPSVIEKKRELETQMKRINTYADELRKTTRRSSSPAAKAVTPRAGASLTLNAPGLTLTRTSSRSQEQAEMIAKLQERIPEVDFSKKPLSDAIDYVRDVTNTNLVLNTKALEAAGLKANTSVTLRLKNSTMAQVLHQIASIAGGGNVALDYAIDNNALIFTTAEDASRYVITRAYNVDDLVSSATTQPGSAGTQNARGDLCKVISDNITPDAWRDAGGTVSAISTFGNTLIISAPVTTHLEVDALLGEVRSVRGNASATFPNGTTGALNLSGINGDIGSEWAAPLPPATRPAGAR